MESAFANNYNQINGRRKFIVNSAAAAGVLLASPVLSQAKGFLSVSDTCTVGQVMDLFIKEVPGGVLTKTVDTLKAGDRAIKITAVVTAMFATIGVIRKSIAFGANFIIVHEPTFYNHADDTDWLKADDVYQYKASLLKEHGIAVWRNHDYIHQLVPDGITKGVLAQLDWQKYADTKIPEILTIPETTLNEVILYLKEKLNIEKVRYMGNTSQPVKRVLFIPGAAGGTKQIQAIGEIKPDVLICGEIHEWETAEYVRDAQAKGNHISLVVTGHIASEEAGSEFMLKWLKEKFPAIKSTHIKPGNSLSFM